MPAACGQAPRSSCELPAATHTALPLVQYGIPPWRGTTIDTPGCGQGRAEQNVRWCVLHHTQKRAHGEQLRVSSPTEWPLALSCAFNLLHCLRQGRWGSTCRVSVKSIGGVQWFVRGHHIQRRKELESFGARSQRPQPTARTTTFEIAAGAATSGCFSHQVKPNRPRCCWNVRCLVEVKRDLPATLRIGCSEGRRRAIG